MLESCSSHLVGLNTVMGNTKIKVEYRGRDIIGETNIRESRVGERRRERGKRRGEKKGGARESGYRNYRGLFSKACAREKLEKTVRNDGSQLL